MAACHTGPYALNVAGGVPKRSQIGMVFLTKARKTSRSVLLLHRTTEDKSGSLLYMLCDIKCLVLMGSSNGATDPDVQVCSSAQLW